LSGKESKGANEVIFGGEIGSERGILSIKGLDKSSERTVRFLYSA